MFMEIIKVFAIFTLLVVAAYAAIYIIHVYYSYKRIMEELKPEFDRIRAMSREEAKETQAKLLAKLKKRER